MKENLKILIIDKETLVHTGLQVLINAHWTDTKFLTEVKTDGVSEEIPDLIVLGTISANRATGIGQIKKLMRKFPSSRILIFSALDEWNYAVPYLNAGARGYLSKHADDQAMVLAIDTVLEGKHLFCNDKLKEQLYNNFFLSYLNGNHRKAFIIKEGLVGYKGGDKGYLTEKIKKSKHNDETSS